MKLLHLLIPAALTAAPQPADLLRSLPLHFEPNQGQSSGEVLYSARGAGMNVYLTGKQTILHRRGADPVRMKLLGSSPAAYEPLERLPGVSHYYHGNDRKKWREYVPHYARVRAKGVYEGVDVVYYGNERRLEYDFIVAPGVDPSVIQLAYEGAESMRVDEGGDLVLVTRAGELRQHKPVVYQESDGRRVEVAGRYRLADGRAGFEVARYDRSKPLVIDPVLSYGTVLGGSGDDRAYGVATDSAGNLFVAGTTASSNFPMQAAADSVMVDYYPEGFVTKISASGNSLLYSTYLGGSSYEFIAALALDSTGAAHVAGSTDSSNLPVLNALQSTIGATSYRDGMFAKLDANGALVFCSYYGGSSSDEINALRLDGSGIYLAGTTSSTDFPGASSSTQSAFVVKLNLAGSTRIYAKTIASSAGKGLAIDSTGAAYITGLAGAAFPATPGAFQGTAKSYEDAFVAKLNSIGSAWAYATLLGGQNLDSGAAIAVDGSGQAFVTGSTASRDFPVLRALDASLGDGSNQSYHEDAFVAGLNATGSGLLFSTYLGGNGQDTGKAIALAATGVFVSGFTASTEFPVVSAWQSGFEGYSADAFLTKISLDGTAIVYSTLFGLTADDVGLALSLDSAGAVVLAGYCYGSDTALTFTTANAYDRSPNGYYDAFVAKFVDGPAAVAVTFQSSPSGRKLRIDGREVITPATLQWQPGTPHTIAPVSPQMQNDIVYTFSNWFQGGTASQSVTAPSSATTYTAAFTSAACSYTLSPASKALGLEGGYWSIQVTTESVCSWTATSNNSWITSDYTPSTPYTGSASVSFRAGINNGVARSGSITLGGATFNVTQSGGLLSLASPTITTPLYGQTLQTRGTGFAWTQVSGAGGYELRILTRTSSYYDSPQLVYSGQQSGAASTTASIELGNGSYTFFVRSCNANGFGDANCGGWASLEMNVNLLVPSRTPVVLRPVNNQTLTSSTNVIEWEPVPGATSYEVFLRDNQRSENALRIVTPGTSTIFTMKSSTAYSLSVGACQVACNTSDYYYGGVNFKVQFTNTPSTAPTGVTAQVQGGNSLTVNWSPVTGADLYRVQVIQPNAGPGGGALTVAARQTATPGITLPVPFGAANVTVQACNGDGCGPSSAAIAINPAGPNPSVPNVGTPMAVINAAGPDVTITWNRIPGDNGSNTTYRLYVGDLSLDAPALDVLTTANFYGARLRAEGRRYDALVFATLAGTTVQGPASGFMVVGTSATAPTMSAPTHGSSIRQGVHRLRWSPITGATRYQYYVSRQGAASATVAGVTPGLFVDVNLPAQNGQDTVYNAIVRACTSSSSSTDCTDSSNAGWGPWSQNVTGTLTFTVTP